MDLLRKIRSMRSELLGMNIPKKIADIFEANAKKMASKAKRSRSFDKKFRNRTFDR